MLLTSKGFTEKQIRWEISLARVNAYLHTARTLDGVEMVWPDYFEQNTDHQRRAWDRFKKWQARQI